MEDKICDINRKLNLRLLDNNNSLSSHLISLLHHQVVDSTLNSPTTIINNPRHHTDNTNNLNLNNPIIPLHSVQQPTQQPNNSPPSVRPMPSNLPPRREVKSLNLNLPRNTPQHQLIS